MQDSSYLFRLASAPNVPFIVQRPDSDPSSSTYGEWLMKLRRRADASKGADVWAEGMVSEGDKVTVVRMNAPDETGFAWVRTSSGAEGFLRSEFLAVAPHAQPAARKSEVLWKAGQSALLNAHISCSSRTNARPIYPYAWFYFAQICCFTTRCARASDPSLHPQACLTFPTKTNLARSSLHRWEAALAHLCPTLPAPRARVTTFLSFASRDATAQSSALFRIQTTTKVATIHPTFFVQVVLLGSWDVIR
jgi:hypothetical protein